MYFWMGAFLNTVWHAGVSNGSSLVLLPGLHEVTGAGDNVGLRNGLWSVQNIIWILNVLILHNHIKSIDSYFQPRSHKMPLLTFLFSLGPG